MFLVRYIFKVTDIYLIRDYYKFFLSNFRQNFAEDLMARTAMAHREVSTLCSN